MVTCCCKGAGDAAVAAGGAARKVEALVEARESASARGDPPSATQSAQSKLSSHGAPTGGTARHRRWSS